MNLKYFFRITDGIPTVFALLLIDLRQILTSSTSDRTKQKHPIPVDIKHATKNHTFNSMMYWMVAANKNPSGFCVPNGYLSGGYNGNEIVSGSTKQC